MTKSRTFAIKTLFGHLLRAHCISPDQAARELKISRQYAYMLAAGTALPGRKLSFRIETWARRNNGSVPVESWNL